MNEPNRKSAIPPSWPDPLPLSVQAGLDGRTDLERRLAELEAHVVELEQVVRRVEAIGIEVRELVDRG